MNKPTVRKLTPALIGLGALLTYILACTSFSPDDSKVLYITVDPKSGMNSVAVYDRKTAKSELLFEPVTPEASNTPSAPPVMVRPQWLGDGHDFLAAWLTGMDNSNASVNLAVLPFDRRGPARTFSLPDLWEDGPLWFYMRPLPVVGSTVYINSGSNVLVRLNLETGNVSLQTNEPGLVVLPSPGNDRLFYLAGMTGDPTKGPNEFGVLDPNTFVRTPLFQIKDTNASVFSMAVSRDVKRLAYEVDDEKTPIVHLLETGQPARTISLASLSADTEVLLRHFSPKGDVLYGAFRTPNGATQSDYGIVEVPLDGSPIRRTTLITGAKGGDKGGFPSFQIDISHDGTTLAVESLWLGFGDDAVKAEDCALFLVDLTDPQRKVTKVPIPLPPKSRPSPFK